MESIRQNNDTKLEQMRQTVDEKLHATLEKRLGESFQLVSERLELVHKSMGEMQNLAKGVGNLEKVLSNVKNRGVMGEMQLGNLLEDFHTRQVLHVTYGSILDRFGKRIKNILVTFEPEYALGLQKHFTKHLAPFAGN